MKIQDLKPIGWKLKDEPFIAIYLLPDGFFHVQIESKWLKKTLRFEVYCSIRSAHKTAEGALASYLQFCKENPDSQYSLEAIQ